MKRVGNLWPEIVSFDNLLGAAHAAARGKRRRPDVARFILDLELELIRLHRELEDGSYQPGSYRTFPVREPKPRMISAAPFRDRVVHHALTRIVEPIFERRFTGDSYACRRGYGTHKAIAVARRAARTCTYVLKCDVVKYFASIDHEILKRLLARVLKCGRTLDLAGKIIGGSNRQEEAIAYFPGDDLFTPYERQRGLPLGNQTSQFFANVYLNPLDHFVRRTLRPIAYFRYVDDFLLFSNDKAELHEMKSRIAWLLEGLRLRIHERKSKVYRAADGVPFLGWQLSPDCLRLRAENVRRFRRRFDRIHRDWLAGRTSLDDVRTRLRAWLAHAAHGDTWRLRGQILARYSFSRRCTV